MNRDLIKRIIAILLLGSLLLGLIPMLALATEADATIRQTLYKEGVGIRVAMSGPIDPNELIVTGPEGEVAIAQRIDDGSKGATDDHTDGHIHDVAARNEFLEFREKLFHFDLSSSLLKRMLLLSL